MIFWTDFETSGLDPKNCVILEVAAVLTDDELEVIDSASYVLGASEWDLRRMDSIVRSMHEASGLLVDVAKSNLHDYAIDSFLTQMLRKNGQEPGVVPLGGSTINFDRAFMEKYLPRTFKYLDYHNCDVSSVKEFAKRWCPDLPERHVPTRAHRALPDILESISLARYYKSAIFQRKANPT